MNRRILTSLIAGLTLAASLSGCGIGKSIVGVHDAPAERTDVAPLNVEGAQNVARRVLDAAAAARGAKGAAAAKAQTAVLADAALAQAQAATKLGSVTASDPLLKASDPQVVAISRGREWPRAMLVGTLDKVSETLTLHVLMSTSAKDAYKVHASVPMHPGTSVPAMDDLATGAQLVTSTDKAGAQLTPAEALSGYAAALNYPKPTANKAITTTDAFATALRKTGTDLTKSFGNLASLSQQHAPVAKNTIAFRLSDGGTVTFGQLTRQDVLTAGSGAKELPIDNLQLQRLSGKKAAPKKLTVTSLENVVMVVPATGAAVAVGADEEFVAATAQ